MSLLDGATECPGITDVWNDPVRYSNIRYLYPKVAMLKQLTIAQAQQRLPSMSEDLHDEPIIITQNGVPVIAALSYQHLSELVETLDILTDTEFVTQLRQSLVQAEQNLTIAWDDAKVQLGL